MQVLFVLRCGQALEVARSSRGGPEFLQLMIRPSMYSQVSKEDVAKKILNQQQTSIMDAGGMLICATVCTVGDTAVPAVVPTLVRSFWPGLHLTLH